MRLLSEEGFEPQMCECWVSLDGLTLRKDGRPLRTYALDSIIRWSLFPKEDIFCFWVRSDADLRQQRAVRLTGDARTVQDLLDALTSACLQLCELLGQKEGGRAGKSAAETDGDEALARQLALEDAKEVLARQKSDAADKKAGSSGGDGGSKPAPKQTSGLGLASLLKGKSKVGLGMNDEGDHIEYWKDPELSGWLQSQGEQVKTWRRRWWVFKNLQMFRFKDANVTPQTVPRGVIRMKECESVQTTDALGAKKCALKIRHTSGEVTYLVADNNVDMVQWLTKIEEGIDNAKGLSRAKTGKAKAAAPKPKPAPSSASSAAGPAGMSEEEQLARAIAASKEEAAAAERARAPPPPRPGRGQSLMDQLSASFEQQAAFAGGSSGGGGGGGAYGLGGGFDRPATYSAAPPAPPAVGSYGLGYGSVEVVQQQASPVVSSPPPAAQQQQEQQPYASPQQQSYDPYGSYGGSQQPQASSLKVAQAHAAAQYPAYGAPVQSPPAQQWATQGMVQVTGYEALQQTAPQQAPQYETPQQAPSSQPQVQQPQVQQPQAADALAAGWTQLTSEEGRPYFFHAASGVTQWETPAC